MEKKSRTKLMEKENKYIHYLEMLIETQDRVIKILIDLKNDINENNLE